MLLSRAAKKKGNMDFNIGGLIYEVTEKEDKYETDQIPQAWLEIVISQINMKEIITDEVLERVNE